VLDPAEHPLGDPHFWLDPTRTMHYVETIRDGLTQVDPSGKEIYTQNASAFLSRLKDLDAWIIDQVKMIPPERRLLVTNHESLGYFADRYGFTITGTIIPSISTSASPSAQQLARLIDRIKASHAPAIFLETGTNPQLADQVARETGVKVITGLYTHSISPPGGNAPDYITMMKWDAQQIVNALK
jgi:manganese/iron transport system substrate-binding protein